MKKYLLSGVGALALGLLATSCSDNDFYSASSSRANAEKVFGVEIDPTHDWNMVQTVNAEVRVNMGTGQKYTYTIYSNDPIAEKKRTYVKKGTISDGGSLSAVVSCPKANNRLYVGLTNAKGYSVFKQAEIVDGLLKVTFGTESAASRSLTRAISVNDDVYEAFPSASDVANYFPTTIPADADEVSELLNKYKGTKTQTQWGEVDMWDIYAIYQYKIVEGYNLKVTSVGSYTNNVVELGGNYQNAGWDGGRNMNIAYPYNVYVNVDGNLTIRRVGATHFNLYILKGNVTLESNYGEQAGLISVASGATLTDQRNSIAANQGVKIYNRGTFNATNTEKYDIGNFCTFYNEGKFTASGALTYSPGDANNSYFMNLGDDAEVTAPSMTLNSTGNFFNSGKVNISGETKCTQARLYWVNNGKYTTGTMTFSAKNCTFYNYCQLYVTDEAKFFDGEFNMMADSYAEIKHGMFNNFIVNMYNNSSIKIIDGTKWGRQGDGTYQGFRAVDDNATCYVRIGGTTHVPVQKEGSLRFNGAKMTFACYEKKFYENYNGINLDSTYDGVSFSDETNKETLDGKGDPRITYNPGNAQETTYGALAIVSPTAESCSGTPDEGRDDDYDEDPQVYTYAFEDTYMGDYDMNDCVLQVWEDEANVYVKLCCTGAAANLHVYLGNQALFGGQEVHSALGGTPGKFINVGDAPADNGGTKSDSKFETRSTVTTTLDKSLNENQNIDIANADFWIDGPSGAIHVTNRHTTAVKTSFTPDWQAGDAPYAVVIPGKWKWPIEWIPVIEAYEEFKGYAEDQNNNIDWYKNPTADKVYTLSNE